jgi:hypothetical protein
MGTSNSVWHGHPKTGYGCEGPQGVSVHYNAQCWYSCSVPDLQSLISTGWFMNPGEVLKTVQLCTKQTLKIIEGNKFVPFVK